MKPVDLFTSENQTDDFRSQVLRKENPFMQKIKSIKLPSITMPLVIISLLVFVVFAMRYVSASYQATLQYQVDVVTAQQKAFVELAKRVGD